MPYKKHTYYTYLWLREDGTPYYVGKGKDGRAKVKHRGKNPPPEERILKQEHPSEKDALAAEVFLISYYGRKDLGTGILNNVSPGGESGGAIRRGPHSEETKRKIGATNALRLKGRKCSEEHCKNIGKGQEGRKLSPEWIKNMSLSRIGKPHPRRKQ